MTLDQVQAFALLVALDVAAQRLRREKPLPQALEAWLELVPLVLAVDETAPLFAVTA